MAADEAIAACGGDVRDALKALIVANRELSVSAIALDIGFSETSTFTAAFHRLTGQTPSRYRRSLD